MGVNKKIICFLTLFLFLKDIQSQNLKISYKNYSPKELEIPVNISFNEYDSNYFEGYLISSINIRSYKQIDESSSFHKFLLNIDMINGWERFKNVDNIKSKSNYFTIFPKDSYDIFLVRYPISKHFKTYLLKLVKKKGDDFINTLEQVFLINIKNNFVVNTSMVSFTYKDGYSGTQQYSLNMGSYFYLTREELYTDNIIIHENLILEKPLSLKFNFNDSGHLNIIE